MSAPKLKYHPAPSREVSLRRRVNFFDNSQDQIVMACALLGWRHRDIADYTGLTIGQVTYRLSVLLGISVTQYRGASRLSVSILKALKDSALIRSAETKALRAADITEELDTRKIKVLA